MEKISWTEHISNGEVLQMVEEERTRQLNWMGHVMREGHTSKEITEG